MRLNRIGRRADQARDSRRFSAAAELYAASVRLAPERTDLRVQLANMLKDAGRFLDAEAAYSAALEQQPDNADIHLQLGHLLKLTGRREEALAAYRRALEISPSSTSPLRELAAAGDSAAQIAEFKFQLRAGGTDALLTISRRLETLSGEIATIRRMLPDALASAAYPIEAYMELRELFDVPPPEGTSTDLSITVVVLADRDRPSDLYAQLSAFRDQSHPNWRVIAVGADPARRAIVDRAAAADDRFTWRDRAPSQSDAMGEMEAAGEAGADWVLLLAPGARPHRHCFAWLAQTAALTGCSAMVFDEELGDPDDVVGGLRPILRHTFDRDTLYEANVYGETVAVAVTALEQVPPPTPTESVSCARSRLLLHLSEAGRIAHLPLPLLRTPAELQRSPASAAGDHRQALSAYLGPASDISVEPSSWSAAVSCVRRAPHDPEAAIAVIVPSKDNLSDLTAFIANLVSLAERPDRLEILVLNNGAPSASDAVRAAHPSVKTLDIAEPFNWSRFNNIGAAETTAGLLVFANDDMRMLTQGWDAILRSLLERDDVGAVGARLFYPDETVQHAGILFDWRGSVIHDGLYRQADEAGPALRWHTSRSVSAVTGAFLATRRSHFEALGGFDAGHLAVSYSDVDYALKLRTQALRILWTPMISLYHHESKTRGLDHLESAKAQRDAAERAVLRARWGGDLDRDPSLNPFWRQATLPHRLLNFPSRDRVCSYIENAARPDPWTVAPPRS